MTQFGDELIAAMTAALKHAEGRKIKAKVHRVAVKALDVRAIRARLQLTQISALLGVSLSGYRK
jgi:hypothetical protein